MPSWRRVFTSDEARIESLAGASPPDPTERYRAALEEIVSRHPRSSWPEHPACLIAATALGDWPLSRVDAAGDEDQETPTPMPDTPFTIKGHLRAIIADVNDPSLPFSASACNALVHAQAALDLIEVQERARRNMREQAAVLAALDEGRAEPGAPDA